MEKILIIGASGFLGTKLFYTLSSRFAVKGTYFSKFRSGLYYLDTTKRKETLAFLKKEDPDIVINTVGIADPDFCELQKDRADLINYRGTKNVVEACRKIKAKLIHISTSYVFDGKRKGIESTKPHPINFYGKTKLLAEKEVKRLKDSLIIRLDILYGYNGRGLPNGLIDKMLLVRKLSLDASLKKQPIWIDDVAKAIMKLIDLKQIGIIHLGGSESMTKYDLVRTMEKKIREKSHLIPNYDMKHIARRPKNSSLNVSLALSLGVKFTPLKKVSSEIFNILKKEGLKDGRVVCMVCGETTKKVNNKFLRYECPFCGYIFYPKPSPAVAALVVSNNKILLVRRAVAPNFGKWSLPSGFVEYGEDPIEAVNRELKEELGIKPVKLNLYWVKVGKDNPEKYILGIYYLVPSFKNKVKLVSKENSGFKWFKPSQLPLIPFRADRYVVRKYLKENGDKNG